MSPCPWGASCSIWLAPGVPSTLRCSFSHLPPVLEADLTSGAPSAPHPPPGPPPTTGDILRPRTGLLGSKPPPLPLKPRRLLPATRSGKNLLASVFSMPKSLSCAPPKSRRALEGRVTGLVVWGRLADSWMSCLLWRCNPPGPSGVSSVKWAAGAHGTGRWPYPLPRARTHKVLDGGTAPCHVLPGTLHPALSSGRLWPCRLCGLESRPPLSPPLTRSSFYETCDLCCPEALGDSISVSL